jgi:protoheme IX farnesyltransferase
VKTIKTALKAYQSLTKSGIVLFVLVVGLCGYTIGMPAGRGVDLNYLFVFLIGLYALSSGSLALNQVQEVGLDSRMDRTQKRPLVVGQLTRWQGLVIAWFLILLGLSFLAIVSLRSAAVGLATVILYNLIYTYIWKKKWIFGAVPGAIPGALPPVIGYVAHEGALWSDPQLFYLFVILFLWQMPHFWILAIKLQDDYRKAGVPVLPVMLGNEKTKLHMGLYLFCYLGLAVMAPLFVFSGVVPSLIIWLFALLVLVTFIRYIKKEEKWLLFFLTLNFSILVFNLVPAISVVKYYL